MGETRQQEIRDKGFNMFDKRLPNEAPGPAKYGSIKVGPKTLDDAVINLGSIRALDRTYGDKGEVLEAIYHKDYFKMREISRFFYRSNGIYARVCDYFAFLYRYDWYVVPEIKADNTSVNNKNLNKNILTDFNSLLSFFDDSNIKKMCGDIALDAIIDGAFYGYTVKNKDRIVLQKLPVNYCRSRYSIGDVPVIEFNMRFFDVYFKDVNERLRVLKMFPQEFQKGYMLYKQNKLTEDYIGEDWAEPGSRKIGVREGHYYRDGWYPLEPGTAIKFTVNNSEQPIFINAIPAILDLDTAQDLDRRKQLQQLQKIIIQQLPLDKNGDLIFDVDEAQDIHNNAVQMLQHAIGTDVLTTFADISVEDVADSNSSDTTDTLERMERAAYNAFGTSRNLFNTDGNLSLEKSILDDASTMRSLLLQINAWLNSIAREKSTKKNKYVFKFYMLETTDYNYQDIAKMYKEQVSLGYSKMLPQVALGHSQSSIIHTAYFENEILKMAEMMIPPISSNTMSAETILGSSNKSTTSQKQSSTSSSSSTTTQTSENEVGRPEKADSEKSEKTIANKESMS